MVISRATVVMPSRASVSMKRAEVNCVPLSVVKTRLLLMSHYDEDAPENSIPRVFACPCISQPHKGEAPSSINGLTRPEVSLETL